MHIKPGTPSQRDRFFDGNEERVCADKRSFFREISIDLSLSFREQLQSEIAQLKAILGPTHPAGHRDRELATRRLMDIKTRMQLLLGG